MTEAVIILKPVHWFAYAFSLNTCGFSTLATFCTASTLAEYESCRSSHPEVFPGKGVLKICKFTGEHPYRSVISIKLLSNFSEITLRPGCSQIALRHGCSPVNLLHIFRTPFPENTSGQLLLLFWSTNVKIIQWNQYFRRVP